MDIYVLKNDEQQGPFPETRIRQGIDAGEFTLDDLAWTEGRSEWDTLESVIASIRSASSESASTEVRSLLQAVSTTSTDEDNVLRVAEDPVQYSSMLSGLRVKTATTFFASVPKLLSSLKQRAHPFDWNSLSKRSKNILLMAGFIVTVLVASLTIHIVSNKASVQSESRIVRQLSRAGQPVLQNRSSDALREDTPSIHSAASAAPVDGESPNPSRESGDEQSRVKEGVRIAAELIANSHFNIIQPRFGFDEKTGNTALLFGQQRSLPMGVEFLMGDIDRVMVTPMNDGTGYAVGLITPEDTKFVKATYASDGKEVTNQTNGFELMFDSEPDAEKVSRIFQFLSQHYSKTGLHSPIPTLTGIPLLEMLVNKVELEVPIVVRVSDGSLTMSQRSGEHYSIQSVRLNDLNPEHFEWNASGERPTVVRLMCKSDKELVTTTHNAISNGKPYYMRSMDASVANERDAKRVAQSVTDLCKAAGWKSDGF